MNTLTLPAQQTMTGAEPAKTRQAQPERTRGCSEPRRPAPSPEDLRAEASERMSFSARGWPIMAVALLLAAAPASAGRYTPEQVLDAIHRVETSGRTGGPMWGDHHQARGPLQIHEGYFRDSGVAGTWADCDDLAFAKKVVLAYWRRYCRDALEAGDAQRLARVHNGGPTGNRKRATVTYWLKVQRELEAR